MTTTFLPAPIDGQIPTGPLLAAFRRAADAAMAAIALADRGVDAGSVQRFTDRELWRVLGSDGAPRPSVDGHWLLVALEPDERSIVAEYLDACGAVQTRHCKNCSNDAIARARIDLLPAFSLPLVQDEKGWPGHALPIAEFHPVPWQTWTAGPAGAGGG